MATTHASRKRPSPPVESFSDPPAHRQRGAADQAPTVLEPATALDVLKDFAAQFREYGEHARELHGKSLAYVMQHFDECASCSSFVELPSETMRALLSSDDLPVEEPVVLSALRVWFQHDAERRKSALKDLVPLVRWPLLPDEVQLALASEPLLLHTMEQGREALALGAQMLIECRSKFRRSAAAAACPRLKPRKGTVASAQSLVFTEMLPQCYQISEEGARVTSNITKYNVARCGDVVMSSGKSCAEFTLVTGGEILIGVARPTLDVHEEEVHATTTDAFWGMDGEDGTVWDGSSFVTARGHGGWTEGFGCNDVVRMLLDLDAGTLTVKKNGQLLGVIVTGEDDLRRLSGDLCWAVACGDSGVSVRIAAVDPNDF